jgi:PAS domain-containing protein
MRDARIIFSDPENIFVRTKRWFRLPKFLAHWAAQKEITVVEDFPSFLSTWPVNNDKQAADTFLKLGYVSFVRYPVVRGDSVVASLTLISKTSRYTDKHKRLLGSLPGIENALLTAVYYEETEELTFRFELMKNVFAAESNQQIADVLTEQLSKHYKWETVCMYRADLRNGRFTLHSQNSHSGDRREGKPFRVPPNDMQPINVGVLGKVYSENRDIRSDNVHTDPEIRGVYRQSREGATSELCMRILVGREVLWLLNIEDSRENAFSEDEQCALRDLLNQVGGLLERIKTVNLISASFESTLTAVFVLDSQGVIRKANPSGLHLLECAERRAVGKNISLFVADSELCQSILGKKKTAPIFTQLNPRRGRSIDVLLWASHLQDDAGVIVLSLQEVASAKRQMRILHSISEQAHAVAH